MWKYLKVAATAVSLLVYVLLIVLCVRSCIYSDYVCGGITKSAEFDIYSSGGGLAAVLWRGSCQAEWTHIRWNDPICEPTWNFKWEQGKVIAIAAPYWFLLTITATIAALPWIKWQFSLRTLLIVMTLFALFFGAIAMSL